MAEVKSTLSPGGDQGSPDPGGAYYVSIVAWEATIQNTNWPAAGDTPVIECYGGDYGGLDGALNERLVIDGGTYSNVHYPTIRAAAGEEHGGVMRENGGTGFLLDQSSTSQVVFGRETGLSLQDIEVRQRSSGNIVRLDSTKPTGYWSINRCILTRAPGDTTAFGILTGGSNTENFDLLSTLVVQDGDGAANLTGYLDLTLGNVVGCTFISRVQGRAVHQNVDIRIIDSVSMGGNNSAFTGSPHPDSANNASGRSNDDADTTAPGANPQYVDTTAFVDYANRNYRPAPAGLLEDTGVYNADADPDIAGVARGTPPEIGAYEIGGGPAPDPVLDSPTAVPAETSALIGCSTDTAGGTLYWYVSTSATAPSAADLKAGTGAVAFGNLVPSLGANTDTATGLTASTQYWHYWIQEV